MNVSFDQAHNWLEQIVLVFSDLHSRRRTVILSLHQHHWISDSRLPTTNFNPPSLLHRVEMHMNLYRRNVREQEHRWCMAQLCCLPSDNFIKKDTFFSMPGSLANTPASTSIETPLIRLPVWSHFNFPLCCSHYHYLYQDEKLTGELCAVSSLNVRKKSSPSKHGSTIDANNTTTFSDQHWRFPESDNDQCCHTHGNCHYSTGSPYE